MIDIKKLAALIAVAPMPEAEREAFIRLIPKLPAKRVAELAAILERQVRAMKKVRADGKKAVAKILDGEKIEALKRKIKSRVE